MPPPVWLPEDGIEENLPPEAEREWESIAQEAREAEAAVVAAAAAAMPVHDPRTSQVNIGDRTIGRIKPMKEGTPGAAVTVYCRLHGCSKIVRPHKMPSHDSVLDWFRLGSDMPSGAEHKCAHLRLWPAGPA